MKRWQEVAGGAGFSPRLSAWGGMKQLTQVSEVVESPQTQVCLTPEEVLARHPSPQPSPVDFMRWNRNIKLLCLSSWPRGLRRGSNCTSLIITLVKPLVENSVGSGYIGPLVS